jgi:hypothetical protein
MHLGSHLGSPGAGKDSLSSLPAAGLRPSPQVEQPLTCTAWRRQKTCTCRTTFPFILRLTVTLITFECPERASFALQDLDPAHASQAGSAKNLSNGGTFHPAHLTISILIFHSFEHECDALLGSRL